jgi:hypothetical protein
MCLISSRQRRRRFTERVSYVNCTVTGSVFMPVTKVPCGSRETAISRDWWLVVVTVVVWCPLRSYVYRDVRIVETQVHIRHLWYWATVTGFVLVPVTKVPCGPRETTISRDRWLVVVTVVVWCPLRICLISNGHLFITFLSLFVTLYQ